MVAQCVGVIGLGLMGSVMARRLLDAGFEVSGFDVRREAGVALEGMGGRALGSVREIADRCDVAVIAVFDTAQVEDVVEGEGGVLSRPAGTRRLATVINTSTCDPDRVASLAVRAARAGLEVVELPISGTSEQVRKGDGFGLVAGNPACVQEVKAVIDAICPRSVHMGEAGNGARAKLAINLVLGLNRAALAEGLVFAERMGLPPEAFLAAARQSAAYSQIMDVKGDKMIARNFTPHGKIGQSAKDFALIREAARNKGQALPLAEVYSALMAGCIAAGEADLDNAAVIEEIARQRT